MATRLRGGMATYRYYFLDRAGHVSYALNFDASSDEGAISIARTLLADNSAADAIEVWDVGRRVRIARRARIEAVP